MSSRPDRRISNSVPTCRWADRTNIRARASRQLTTPDSAEALVDPGWSLSGHSTDQSGLDGKDARPSQCRCSTVVLIHARAMETARWGEGSDARDSIVRDFFPNGKQRPRRAAKYRRPGRPPTNGRRRVQLAGRQRVREVSFWIYLAGCQLCQTFAQVIGRPDCIRASPRHNISYPDLHHSADEFHIKTT